MIVNFSKAGGNIILTNSSGQYYVVLAAPEINFFPPMYVKIQTTQGLVKFDISSTSDIQFNGTSSLSASDITNQILNLYTVNPQLSSNGSTGSTNITSAINITANDGQLSFTFVNVPTTTSDYMIFKNRVLMGYGSDYTTLGNVVTLTIATRFGDVVSYQRIK